MVTVGNTMVNWSRGGLGVSHGVKLCSVGVV